MGEETTLPRPVVGAGAPPLPVPVLGPGQLLARRYRLERFLAEGGMGQVYEALDLELGVAVALKTIRPGLASGDEGLRRFKREVLLGRSISHPNVCRVFDIGRDERDGGEVTFLTMELLAGETLVARLRREGRMSETEALPLVRQMAEGLEAAHRAGVVHRDFKSANVIVAPGPGDERVVITDFGLARALRGAAAGAAGEEEAPLTEVGMVVGTPAYMAPEQLRGEETGPAADLYALGVVLFELVTGSRPRGESPSPGASVPGLDPRWDEAIRRLLRSDPRERFASAGEVVRALEGRVEPVAVRHGLPAERDAFVGREAELEALARRLEEGARLVTVIGPGGTGKTRLAARFGWSALSRFPGGAWFADLSEARSELGLVHAVATALDVPLGKDDPVVQLGHAIAGRGRTLVVLDNFEQVAEHAEATLGRWLARAAEARFLVTSRERLKLPGEELVPLEPLAVGTEGVRLFELRARAQRPGFVVDAGNREAVSEVVRLLDGLPLAIELAAARVRLLGPEQVLERLRDRFRLLVGGEGRPARQRTLEAAIGWSWEQLEPWEKAALAQASLFVGGFTLEAAEEVLDLAVWPGAPPVLDVVQALLDRSLLGAAEAEGEARLSMLVSVQEYAARRLDSEQGAGARRAAEERHGSWFARRWGEEAVEALDRAGGVLLRRRLALDLDNLVSACRRAVARGDGPTAGATHRAAWQVLRLRGPYAVSVELGRAVVGLPLAPAHHGSALMMLGQSLWRSGRMEEARALHEEALAVHRRAGDRRREGDVLGSLGNVCSTQGRMTEAQAAYEEALAIHRVVGDRGREGVVLGLLGLRRLEQGRMEEARALFESALAIAREVGDRRGEDVVLANLGVLHLEQGRMEEARALYESALAITREVGDRRGEGQLIGNLGSVDLEQRRMEEARARFEEALAIAREVGDRLSQGIVLGNLGVLCLEEGRLEQARALYEQALAVLREVGNRRWQGIVVGLLAELHLALGALPAAREALPRGEALLRETGDRLELGKLLCVRGELEQAEGDLERARATLAEAEALAAATSAGPASELGRRLARLRAALAGAR